MRMIAPSIMTQTESGWSSSSCFPTITAGSLPFRDWRAPQQKPNPGKRQSPLKGPAVIVPSPVRTLPLRSLQASALAPGFQAWFGRDGKRMVCSVYPVQQGRLKGLPDFRDALVIAVRREGEDLKAVAFFSIEPDMVPDVLRPLIDRASHDAQEWHVHLPLPDRRAALKREFAALVE